MPNSCEDEVSGYLLWYRVAFYPPAKLLKLIRLCFLGSHLQGSAYAYLIDLRSCLIPCVVKYIVSCVTLVLGLSLFTTKGRCFVVTAL
jgi:hypothetical protein